MRHLSSCSELGALSPWSFGVLLVRIPGSCSMDQKRIIIYTVAVSDIENSQLTECRHYWRVLGWCLGLSSFDASLYKFCLKREPHERSQGMLIDR